MITKRDFEVLADKLKSNRPLSNWSANKHVQWDQDVAVIADACARLNPGFKRAKFLAACGGLFSKEESK